MVVGVRKELRIMSNREKYTNAFINAFEIEEGVNVEEYRMGESPNWDSMGHMTLITNLEDDFEIMFEADDIINFNSFANGIDIMKKYDVEI